MKYGLSPVLLSISHLRLLSITVGSGRDWPCSSPDLGGSHLNTCVYCEPINNICRKVYPLKPRSLSWCLSQPWHILVITTKTYIHHDININLGSQVDCSNRRAALLNSSVCSPAYRFKLYNIGNRPLWIYCPTPHDSAMPYSQGTSYFLISVLLNKQYTQVHIVVHSAVFTNTKWPKHLEQYKSDMY